MISTKISVLTLLLLSCLLTTEAFAQARERFLKEAPIAWEKYREKLDTRIHVVGTKHAVLPFELMVDRNGRCLYKWVLSGDDINLIEGSAGKDYFARKKTDSGWTIVKNDRGFSDERCLALLRTKLDGEIYRLLRLTGYSHEPNRFLDELLKDSKITLDSVKATTSDGHEYFELVIRDAQKSGNQRLTTIILDPSNYWTIKKCIYLDDSEKRQETFETVKFVGVVVPAKELIDIHESSSGIETSSDIVERKFFKIDEDEISRAILEAKGLVSTTSARKTEMLPPGNSSSEDRVDVKSPWLGWLAVFLPIFGVSLVITLLLVVVWLQGRRVW